MRPPHSCGRAFVIPIFQPAHSPELNPIERLWQDLKKPFKCTNFETLASLRAAVFQAVNTLSNTTIQSLTGWDYILAALNNLKKMQPF